MSPSTPTPASPQAQGSFTTSPIEHVINSLGIHPHSGLAHAFRAIHAALAAHMASQVGHGSIPHPGIAPVRPGPILQ